MVDARRPLRDDELVEVAPEGDEARPAAGGGCRELLQQVGAGPQLADEPRRQQVGGGRAGVRAAERAEGVHPRVAAHALHVVARDDAAERVADDVDALVPGGLAGALDELGEARGRAPDVLR